MTTARYLRYVVGKRDPEYCVQWPDPFWMTEEERK
jgi:hypothetical protein